MIVENDLPFIRREHTDSLFAAINQAVNSRSIITIGAHYGRGLSRLLREWVMHEPKDVQPNQVVLVQLMDPEMVSFRNMKLMTPAALLLMWETCYALRGLTKAQRSDSDRSTLAKGGSDYSESRFLQLCAELRTLAKKLQLRAIVIDNAHHVDDRGLRKLMEPCDHCEYKFAIILGYQMRNHAKPAERIHKVLEEGGAFDQWADSLVLESMEEHEFYDTILPELYLALDTEFNRDIEAAVERFQSKLWAHTGGNWHQIERIATLFDQDLGPKSENARIITGEVEARVYQRLDKVRRN